MYGILVWTCCVKTFGVSLALPLSLAFFCHPSPFLSVLLPLSSSLSHSLPSFSPCPTHRGAMQEKRAPVRCDTDSSMVIYDLTSSNGSSPSDKHACLNVPRHAVDTSISRCAISVTSTSILISRQAIFPAMPIKTAWTASCNDQSPTFLIRRIRAWSSVTSRANAS